MRLLSLLILSFCWVCRASGATVLATYDGSTAPNTQGWIHVSNNTNLTGQALVDEGRTVWQLTDPGMGGTSSGTNQYYYSVINNTKHGLMTTQGWDLSAVIKIPTDFPTNQVAWGNDRNIWFAYIHVNPDSSTRSLYGLMLGRDASGNATVQGYNSSGVKVVGTGYHEYSIRYNPATSSAGIYVDGIFWKNLAPGILDGTGQQMVYWGDNNAQSTPIDARAANWDFVQLSIVPEPKTTGLLAMGLLGILFWTRKRQSWLV